MTISVLQNKEKMLEERASMLRSSIQEQNSLVNEHNIEAQALEINKLETQLKLTEKALENIQGQLREQEKLINSKEYKDKQKMKEKLIQQAKREAGEVLEGLKQLLAQAEKAEGIAKEAGKLEKELTIEKELLAYAGLKFRQPFLWLYGLKQEIQKQLKNARFIQDKFEV